MRAFVPASPLIQRLGIELIEVDDDRAELRLPFDPANATLGETVHGGAIATLIDSAGMAASWADERVPETLAGSTATLNVDYLAPANGVELTAAARVTRRGRRLCFVSIDVREPSGKLIARGSMVHSFG